jgi:hypothetical protein
MQQHADAKSGVELEGASSVGIKAASGAAVTSDTGSELSQNSSATRRYDSDSTGKIAHILATAKGLLEPLRTSAAIAFASTQLGTAAEPTVAGHTLPLDATRLDGHSSEVSPNKVTAPEGYYLAPQGRLLRAEVRTSVAESGVGPSDPPSLNKHPTTRLLEKDHDSTHGTTSPSESHAGIGAFFAGLNSWFSSLAGKKQADYGPELSRVNDLGVDFRYELKDLDSSFTRAAKLTRSLAGAGIQVEASIAKGDSGLWYLRLKDRASSSGAAVTYCLTESQGKDLAGAQNEAEMRLADVIKDKAQFFTGRRNLLGIQSAYFDTANAQSIADLVERGGGMQFAKFSDMKIANKLWAGVDMQTVVAENVAFRKVIAINSDWRGFHGASVDIIECNFNYSQLGGAQFAGDARSQHQSRIRSTTFNGAVLSDKISGDVKFHSADLGDGNPLMTLARASFTPHISWTSIRNAVSGGVVMQVLNNPLAWKENWDSVKSSVARVVTGPAQVLNPVAWKEGVVEIARNLDPERWAGNGKNSFDGARGRFSHTVTDRMLAEQSASESLTTAVYTDKHEYHRKRFFRASEQLGSYFHGLDITSSIDEKLRTVLATKASARNGTEAGSSATAGRSRGAEPGVQDFASCVIVSPGFLVPVPSDPETLALYNAARSGSIKGMPVKEYKFEVPDFEKAKDPTKGHTLFVETTIDGKVYITDSKNGRGVDEEQWTTAGALNAIKTFQRDPTKFLAERDKRLHPPPPEPIIKVQIEGKWVEGPESVIKKLLKP